MKFSINFDVKDETVLKVLQLLLNGDTIPDSPLVFCDKGTNIKDTKEENNTEGHSHTVKKYVDTAKDIENLDKAGRSNPLEDQEYSIDGDEVYKQVMGAGLSSEYEDVIDAKLKVLDAAGMLEDAVVKYVNKVNSNKSNKYNKTNNGDD